MLRHMWPHTPMLIRIYTRSDALGTDLKYSSRSTLYQIYQIYSDMQE